MMSILKNTTEAHGPEEINVGDWAWAFIIIISGGREVAEGTAQ